MRRTTDPGSPALTFASLPNVLRARSLPLKHFEQYSPGYVNGIRPRNPFGKGQEGAGKGRARSKKEARGQPEGDTKMTEKLANNRYGEVDFGQLHVHLPLHLLCASETMVPAPPPYRYDREFRECLAWGRMDRPCSSRYGRAFRR
ncbi:hypothetical protein GCM10010398_25740 [Streptomyces fimbriatus]